MQPYPNSLCSSRGHKESGFGALRYPEQSLLHMLSSIPIGTERPTGAFVRRHVVHFGDVPTLSSFVILPCRRLSCHPTTYTRAFTCWESIAARALMWWHSLKNIAHLHSTTRLVKRRAFVGHPLWCSLKWEDVVHLNGEATRQA